MRDLLLLGLCACGPRWLDAHEEPHALHEALLAASDDHRCDQVVPRCDASHDSTWEFELDVCGSIRRYTVTDRSVGEVPVGCAEAICLGPTPPCRSVVRGGWWPVETHAPERCDDAPVDDQLRVDFDATFVKVEADGPRWIDASCTSPSLMVSIDGRWFALCGSRAPGAVDRISVEPGLMTGAGDHDVYAVYLEGGGCVRSRAEAVRTAPTSWQDIVIVD